MQSICIRASLAGRIAYIRMQVCWETNSPVRETLGGVPVALAAAADGEVSHGVRVEIGLGREKENFDIRRCHPIL